MMLSLGVLLLCQTPNLSCLSLLHIKSPVLHRRCVVSWLKQARGGMGVGALGGIQQGHACTGVILQFSRMALATAGDYP